MPLIARITLADELAGRNVTAQESKCSKAFSGAILLFPPCAAEEASPDCCLASALLASLASLTISSCGGEAHPRACGRRGAPCRRRPAASAALGRPGGRCCCCWWCCCAPGAGVEPGRLLGSCAHDEAERFSQEDNQSEFGQPTRGLQLLVGLRQPVYPEDPYVSTCAALGSTAHMLQLTRRRHEQPASLQTALKAFFNGLWSKICKSSLWGHPGLHAAHPSLASKC